MIFETSDVFYSWVKEVRARTIGQGWTVPQAAGVIHTDFEKDLSKSRSNQI